MKITNIFKEYNVVPISKSIAKEFIIKHHYTHTFPVSVVSLGAFYDNKLIGVIVYGMSPTPRMANSVVGYLRQDEYLELQRLFVMDCTPKNFESWFISRSICWIRANKTQVKLLVSFADPYFNHVGTVYQATNWLYVGKTHPTTIFLDSDGIVKHQRTIAKGNTDKSNLIKVKRPAKNRYLMFLCKGIDVYYNLTDNSLVRLEDLEYWLNKEKEDGIMYLERIHGNLKKHKKNFKKDMKYRILEYPKK